MRRNAFGQPSCPDCPAVADGCGDLRHVEWCPVAADLDDMRSDDAQWFRDHPNSGPRRRPIRWGEREMLAATKGCAPPEGATWHGDVLVHELEPGVRLKSFVNVVAMLPSGGAR